VPLARICTGGRSAMTVPTVTVVTPNTIYGGYYVCPFDALEITP
jgi:hypothetical protein